MARSRRIALSIPHATALPRLIENTDLLATIPKVIANYFVARGVDVQGAMNVDPYG